MKPAELSKSLRRGGTQAWCYEGFLCASHLKDCSASLHTFLSVLGTVENSWLRKTQHYVLRSGDQKGLKNDQAKFLILWSRKLKSRQEIGLSRISQQGCIQLANSKEEPVGPNLPVPLSVACSPTSVYFEEVSFPYHGKALILFFKFYWSIICFTGFPCGSAGKESTCTVGDLSLIPGLGRFPGEGKGYPLKYSGLEKPMD